MVALALSTPTAVAAATVLFTTLLALLTAPLVAGTFGDLFDVTLDAVDNGFRVGVNLAVAVVFVNDAPNEVLVAGLCVRL